MTDALALKVLGELRALRAEVAEQRADIQHLMRRLLAADDRRTGIVLLPLAREVAGDRIVTLPALFATALNDRTPGGQALREVMVEYGSVKQLGKLIARLDGAVLGGCRAEPAGERSEGRAWRVRRVSDD